VVGEPLSVVADLGEQPGAGDGAQAGEAGGDHRVRVLQESGFGGLEELVGGVDGGVELQQQCPGVLTERLLNLTVVPQRIRAEDPVQPLDSRSIPWTASTCAVRSPAINSSGILASFARHAGASGSVSASRSTRASVSGRGRRTLAGPAGGRRNRW
jgi:hypothetical protein